MKVIEEHNRSGVVNLIEFFITLKETVVQKEIKNDLA
jgi:hypothetical protein